MIYFDQAASSFPKPIEVADVMFDAVVSIGANPGRGSHALARKASLIIQETRENIASSFGCGNPKKVIFHPNATSALNQALNGIGLEQGDHVITTSYEHNSVRRPLEFLKVDRGIDVTYVSEDDEKEFNLSVIQAIRPTTKLIVMTHASNVTGAITPIKKICAAAKEHHIMTLVDASQTAGHLPIHMQHDDIDLLAFPGHKGLLGPQGTGVLLVEGEIDLQPIVRGGTGAYSEIPQQPNQWPEKLESGTLNTPGIAGLNAAIKHMNSMKPENVPRETLLINKVIKGLKSIPDIILYGPGPVDIRLPITAFNVKGVNSQEIAMVLDSHYNIAVRAGLHCNPLTHEMLGTTKQGMVRVSVGNFNTVEEVEQFLQAISEIVSAYNEI